MKILEYIKTQEETLPPNLAKILIGEASIWTNDAAYGYCISAMEAAGYKREEIRDMLHYMHSAFEELTVEEAEQKYINW